MAPYPPSQEELLQVFQEWLSEKRNAAWRCCIITVNSLNLLHF